MNGTLRDGNNDGKYLHHRHRRVPWRDLPVRGRAVDRSAVGTQFSPGNSCDQRERQLSHRPAHVTVHGTFHGEPAMAIAACSRLPWRIYHVFHLRVRNRSVAERQRVADRGLKCCVERFCRVRRPEARPGTVQTQLRPEGQR